MSAAQQFAFKIRITRILRVGLDIALLVALLGLFIQLSFFSDSHHTSVLSKQYLANAMKKTKMHSTKTTSVEHIEELHDSESSMWSSFFEWQGQSNYAAGSCWFMSPNEQYPDKFRLLCLGENKQPGVAVKAEPIQIFVAKTTGQLNKKMNAIKPTEQDGFDVQPPVVSGWLDTPSGRKYFDSVSKQWKP